MNGVARSEQVPAPAVIGQMPEPNIVVIGQLVQSEIFDDNHNILIDKKLTHLRLPNAVSAYRGNTSCRCCAEVAPGRRNDYERRKLVCEKLTLERQILT